MQLVYVFPIGQSSRTMEAIKVQCELICHFVRLGFRPLWSVRLSCSGGHFYPVVVDRRAGGTAKSLKEDDHARCYNVSFQ